MTRKKLVTVESITDPATEAGAALLTAATSAANAQLGTKVNSATYTAGMAGKLSIADIPTSPELKSVVQPVKQRTRRQIERAATGITRRCTIPAGLGWNPGIPILTDGARYWSPFDVATMKNSGGSTFYLMPSHGLSSGTGRDLGTLTAPLDAGVSTVSLPITASAQAASSGARLALISGTTVVPVIASTAVVAGATSVSVNAVTPGVRLPAGTKLVSVRNRIHDLTAITNPIVPGDTVMLLDKFNDQQVFQGYTLALGINIIALQPGTVASLTTIVTWALASGYSNVYQATRTNVRVVVDIEADPDGFEYTRVNSLAECNALPGSWFQATDGTGLVSIRTLSGAAPDTTKHLVLATYGQLIVSPADGQTVYIEGVRFFGGTDGLQVDRTSINPATVVMKDCGVFWAGYGTVGATVDGLTSGLRVVGNVTFFAQRVRGAHAGNDAISYSSHTISSVSYAPRFMELDCEAYAGGTDSLKQGFRLNGSYTGYSDNASTSHGGSLGIRVGGRYHDSAGTPVCDVQAGTKTANFGIDAWGSHSTYDPFNGAIGIQQAGTEMWLFGCRAWGTKNDVYNVAGSILHVLDATEYDTSSGTLVFTT